jgi:glycosyltransferase involved in cell wall biosynthesis
MDCAASTPIHVLFLIRSLEWGGAERQLVELVKGLDKRRFLATVVTFYDGGALRPEIMGLDGVTVLSLHKKGRWDLAPLLGRLARIVAQSRPQIVHGYMGIANEMALFTGRAVGCSVVWGLRASTRDFSRYDAVCARSFRVGARLSRFPDLIIYNSEAGRKHHIAQGYRDGRDAVIRNGIDTDRFQPDAEARYRMRAEWGIAAKERLIGAVGRLDPVKDHPTFLRAAAALARERDDVRFVCVGTGPESYRRELEALAEEAGLGRRIVWAGALSDMNAAYNAFDLAASSSSGEGFSNVIAEAMACGTPCVVTDVGDSAVVVGIDEHVVPPRNPEAMKAAWARLLAIPSEAQAALSRRVRDRIVTEFSVQRLVRRTESCLMEVLACRS